MTYDQEQMEWKQATVEGCLKRARNKIAELTQENNKYKYMVRQTACMLEDTNPERQVELALELRQPSFGRTTYRPKLFTADENPLKYVAMKTPVELEQVEVVTNLDVVQPDRVAEASNIDLSDDISSLENRTNKAAVSLQVMCDSKGDSTIPCRLFPEIFLKGEYGECSQTGGCGNPKTDSSGIFLGEIKHTVEPAPFQDTDVLKTKRILKSKTSEEGLQREALKNVDMICYGELTVPPVTASRPTINLLKPEYNPPFFCALPSARESNMRGVFTPSRKLFSSRHFSHEQCSNPHMLLGPTERPSCNEVRMPRLPQGSQSSGAIGGCLTPSNITQVEVAGNDQRASSAVKAADRTQAPRRRESGAEHTGHTCGSCFSHVTRSATIKNQAEVSPNKISSLQCETKFFYGCIQEKQWKFVDELASTRRARKAKKLDIKIQNNGRRY